MVRVTLWKDGYQQKQSNEGSFGGEGGILQSDYGQVTNSV